MGATSASAPIEIWIWLHFTHPEYTRRLLSIPLSVKIHYLKIKRMPVIKHGNMWISKKRMNIFNYVTITLYLFCVNPYQVLLVHLQQVVLGSFCHLLRKLIFNAYNHDPSLHTFNFKQFHFSYFQLCFEVLYSKGQVFYTKPPFFFSLPSFHWKYY